MFFGFNCIVLYAHLFHLSGVHYVCCLCTVGVGVCMSPAIFNIYSVNCLDLICSAFSTVDSFVTLHGGSRLHRHLATYDVMYVFTY